VTEPEEQQTAVPASPVDAGPERQSTPFLVLQFFIFPMAIVAVCVAVFVVFGLIAAEGKSAREYVGEVRNGGANRRWQAAFELSKVIQAKKDPALHDPKFVDELLTLFDDAQKDDPRVRRYLALALGRLGDKRAVSGLVKCVETTSPDADPETLIYSIWALGAIGDPLAVPPLVRLAQADDAGLRKAAVHALGAIPSEAAKPPLVTALQDAVVDVRWNAALALARRGDPAAAPVIAGMLDRVALEKLKDVSPEQQEDALLGAVVAAASLKDATLMEAVRGLAERDPSLKVREAAGAALRARPGVAAAP
jgi:HEAT repeat protein